MHIKNENFGKRGGQKFAFYSESADHTSVWPVPVAATGVVYSLWAKIE